MSINRNVSALSFGCALIGLATLVYTATASLTSAHHRPGHTKGGGGDDNTGTTFSVAIVAGEGEGNWVLTRDGCEGFTDSRKLHVTFPADGGCEPPHVMTGVDDMCCDFWVYTLDVRDSRDDVQFFMTDVALVYPDVQPSVYNHGDVGRLPWKRENLDEGSFQLKVDLKDQYLTKIGNPGRGDMVGPIAIGYIVYTPNPPPE